MADPSSGMNPKDPKRPVATEGHFVGLAERRIQEAIESGDFDDLPGTGKPLPGAGTPDDELWWLRSFLERERAAGN